MSGTIQSLILLSITGQLIMDNGAMSIGNNRTNEPHLSLLVSKQPTNTNKTISLFISEMSWIHLDLVIVF